MDIDLKTHCVVFFTVCIPYFKILLDFEFAHCQSFFL